MKQIFQTLLLIILFTGISIDLKSAGCNAGDTADTHYTYVCGEADTLAHIASAKQNCCKGSEIHFVDFCDGGWGHFTVPENGPNSTCAAPEGEGLQ